MSDWLGSAISAGASLIGGNQAQKDAENANRVAWKNTKTLAKNSIQWRVNDAKKAGLHPLYAMGAPAASPAPSGSVAGNGIAQAGAEIARGLSNRSAAKRNATIDNQATQLHQLQLIESAARAKKDFAHAALYNSEVKRAEGRGNIRQDGAGISIFGGAPLTYPGSSADAAEQEFGGIISEFVGLGNAANAGLRNAQKRARAPAKRYVKKPAKKQKRYYHPSQGSKPSKSFRY